MGMGMGFCCCGSAIVMVVLAHTRYLVSGSTYASITAYDGTSNSSGTLLWQYDLGESDTGLNWQPGQPRIDADGNVYVASWGITDENAGGVGTHEYTGRLTKIDVTGTLVWDYYTEAMQTNNGSVSSAVGNGSIRAPCCSIMDDGNIVFGHFSEPTSTNIMSIIDSAGNFVSGIPYPGGSIPSISVIAPICSLDCDSSGNIYFTPLTPAVFDQKVYKVDSGGTFIASFTGTSIQVSVIKVDRDNGKFYAGTYQTTSSWASGNAALHQVDCSSMTADWVMSLTDVAGTGGTAQSSCQQNSLGLSPSGNLVYSTITAKTSPGAVYVAECFAADANTGTKGLDWSSIPTTSFSPNFNAAACDPTTGDTFFTQSQAISVDRIWKLDEATGATLWSTLGISATTARAIDARSV